MKRMILILLVLVGMFAFAQNGEIEILRTIDCKEYQIEETIKIFSDSVHLQTNKGFLSITYAEIDTVIRVPVTKL